ncbi:glycosyltransferase family 39 protein [Patescibacteria group bacterium]
MLKKIFSNKVWLIFIFYFAFHAFLLNVNYAEWGDSYRILRASEFIRKGTYPEDEKRVPMYSLLLAARPGGIDQVVWGRVVMLGLSVALMYVFYLYIKEFKFGERVEQLSLWLLALNPIFLYWSIRIMADVPFTLLVMIVFYAYKKWENELLWWKSVILGGLLGLGVLTRFEGYILGFSLGLALILKTFIAGNDSKKEKIDKEKMFKLIKTLTAILLGVVIVTISWFLTKNPFSSTYFEEPGGRVYDLNMIYTYLVSSMYIFGFTSACYFFIKHFSKAKEFLVKNIFLTIFVFIELVLCLVWPAAIPRLFVPVIPFLVFLLAYLVNEEFLEKEKASTKDILILLSIFFFYVGSQYILKLQFLVLIKPLWIAVLLIQPLIIYAIVFKKYRLFKVGLILSMLVWSLSTIYLHKDIFKAVVEANKYAVRNLEGKVVHNDVSSVSDWYLNQKSSSDKVFGEYLDMDSKMGRDYYVLVKEEVNYIMITNEHNTDLEFSADEKEYLEEIEEFRYTIRDKEFFTKIVKFIPYD